jgi:hypothetical protein
MFSGGILLVHQGGDEELLVCKEILSDLFFSNFSARFPNIIFVIHMFNLTQPQIQKNSTQHQLYHSCRLDCFLFAYMVHDSAILGCDIL